MPKAETLQLARILQSFLHIFYCMAYLVPIVF